MNFTDIIFEKLGTTAVIRLNRPERMNAVSEEMYSQLIEACNIINNDDSIRSAIITGSIREKNGVKKQAFCAGADLKKHSTGERSHGEKRQYIELAHRATFAIHELKVPVIAVINGPARGAGSEIAINCDFIIMSNEATIGFPEIGLGTFVGGGTTNILPKLLGEIKAKELIFTGRVLSGKDAMDIGLAIASHGEKELFDEALKFAIALGEKAPLSLALAKKMIGQSHDLNLETALNLETDGILKCMDTEDWAEGVVAFGEKRKPIYRGK